MPEQTTWLIGPILKLQWNQSFANRAPIGLYYKHSMMIVSDDHKWRQYYKCVIAFALANYALRVTLQIVASLTYNSRGVIYNYKMFIV